MIHRPSSLLPLLCLTVPLFAQGEVDLRTTAKKGNTVWLAVETKNEQTIDMGGQEAETSQTIKRVLNVSVKDVDDKGNLVVETKIARVLGNMTMPMGGSDIDFDSATPSEDEDGDDVMGGMGAMMKKAMLAGAGKSFTAKLSPNGKVVELDADAKALLEDNQGGMMSGNSLDEATLKQMVEGAFGTLPEKPIAVGAKWQHDDRETSGRMPMQHKLELTLVKADADAFEVAATGTVERREIPPAKDGEDGDPQQEMAREMMRSMKVRDGKLTGSQRVSRKDGFVIDASNTVVMKVAMEGPMGEMDMDMKTTVTTKRTTPDAAAAKADAKNADAATEPAPKTPGGQVEPPKQGGR